MEQHIKKPLDEEVVFLYDIEKFTLREIAKIYGSDHHTVRRFLVKQGIEINRNNRRKTKRSDETRLKQSIARKEYYRINGLPQSMFRIPSKKTILKMRATKLKTTRDLSIYEDYEKFNFLIGITSRNRSIFERVNDEKIRDELRFQFVDHF